MGGERERCEESGSILECGGKRSATPLSDRGGRFNAETAEGAEVRRGPFATWPHRTNSGAKSSGCLGCGKTGKNLRPKPAVAQLRSGRLCETPRLSARS